MRRFYALILASLLVLQGCQYALALWVTPGSRARHLIFGIADRRDGTDPVRLTSIRVYRCVDIYWRGPDRGSYPAESQLVWGAESESDDRTTETTRFAYGQDPKGLKSVVAPRALDSPGCYFVLVYAYDSRGNHRGATVGFRVLTDGPVEEMSEAERDRLFSEERSGAR